MTQKFQPQEVTQRNESLCHLRFMLRIIIAAFFIFVNIDKDPGIHKQENGFEQTQQSKNGIQFSNKKEQTTNMSSNMNKSKHGE